MFGLESVLEKEKAKLLSPVVLAFVGDAVFSLYVRERLVFSSGGRAADYQLASAKLVSAHGQSDFLEEILPLLNEEEEEIYRRGRNAKKATKSKNASPAEYNRSTGFEAVLGYLYITGEKARIDELLNRLGEEKFKIESVASPFKPVR